MRLLLLCLILTCFSIDAARAQNQIEAAFSDMKLSPKIKRYDYYIDKVFYQPDSSFFILHEKAATAHFAPSFRLEYFDTELRQSDMPKIPVNHEINFYGLEGFGESKTHIFIMQEGFHKLLKYPNGLYRKAYRVLFLNKETKTYETYSFIHIFDNHDPSIQYFLYSTPKGKVIFGDSKDKGDSTQYTYYHASGDELPTLKNSFTLPYNYKTIRRELIYADSSVFRFFTRNGGQLVAFAEYSVTQKKLAHDGYVFTKETMGAVRYSYNVSTGRILVGGYYGRYNPGQPTKEILGSFIMKHDYTTGKTDTNLSTPFSQNFVKQCLGLPEEAEGEYRLSGLSLDYFIETSDGRVVMAGELHASSMTQQYKTDGYGNVTNTGVVTNIRYFSSNVVVRIHDADGHELTTRVVTKNLVTKNFASGTSFNLGVSKAGNVFLLFTDHYKNTEVYSTTPKKLRGLNKGYIAVVSFSPSNQATKWHGSKSKNENGIYFDPSEYQPVLGPEKTLIYYAHKVRRQFAWIDTSSF